MRSRRRISRAGISKTGIGLLALLILTAAGADILAPYSPWERFEPFQAPGSTHWLGTNDLGHDILSELIHGSRISLLVGFGAAALATLIGLIVGLIAGYFRGTVDEILMGVTDVFLLIPRIPLIIVLAAFLRPGFWLIAMVIGLLWWTSIARLVRSKTLQVREMNFVQSARCLGFSHGKIIFSEILPNILQVVWPKFLLTIAAAMISEASLAFLGLGDPTQKSWGMMLNFAFREGGFLNEMWWWFLPPGLCITLAVSAVVLFGFSVEREMYPAGEILE